MVSSMVSSSKPLDPRQAEPYSFTMNVRRSFGFALFLYDLVRLVALIGLLSLLRSSLESARLGNLFPLIALGSSNALFLLMSFFLWFRPSDYAPFGSLYTAGKVLGITASVAWFILSFRGIFLSLGMDTLGTITVAGLTLALAVGDGLSILMLRYSQGGR